MYARFADLGHEIMRVREEVTAPMPTPDEVRGLAIPDGVPVLDVLHTGIDAEGRAFEVLDVMTKDAAAIRLYERLGWRRLGSTQHDDGKGRLVPAACSVGP